MLTVTKNKSLKPRAAVQSLGRQRALAHQDENKVRAAYNRAQFWNERVALLQVRRPAEFFQGSELSSPLLVSGLFSA